MALVVLAVLLCLISTEDPFTTEQCLKAYNNAKRIVRRAGMSRDRRGGDRRVNIEPMTMSVHHLFFREHNRISDTLSAAHPNWTDNVIFQKARRIVVAEMQIIAYGEYLLKILGDDIMERYGLKPLLNGTTQYSRKVDPNTRNSFAAACVFNSHFGIRFAVTIGGIEYPLSSIFFNPDIFYDGTDADTYFARTHN